MTNVETTKVTSTLPSIHRAVCDPHLSLDTVEAILWEDPSCLNSANPQNGFTPLHAAARRAHSGLIQLLIKSGANLEAQWRNGETAFLMACKGGSLCAVHTFVEGGANVRMVDDGGRGAMYHAAQVGALHIMHYLSVTQGLGFQTTDNEGNTPLHTAVANRNLETIRYLLKYNRVSACATNKRGSTPLHVAAVLGSLQMSWMLVNSTKENLVDCKDMNGYTPLDHCRMGKSPRHATLAKKLSSWSTGPSWLAPRLCQLLFFTMPGTSLLLAMLAFSNLRYMLGMVLAIIIVIAGFFWPSSPHRLPHDSKWPNPALFGALISGLIHTSVCYFTTVFPHILPQFQSGSQSQLVWEPDYYQCLPCEVLGLWPDNFLRFIIVIFNSIVLLYILIKFKMTDPGFDRVGKISSDGNPLTIVDVARQGKDGDCAFCASCEIVIPERTKHCKLCSGCCNGFDHHCTWLFSCVGYNNHRLFILFTFFLGLDNFLFVWEALACLAMITDSYSPGVLLSKAFFDERWILFLIICNVWTGLFVWVNFYQQLNLISRMETTYFDMSGRPAYNKKRERRPLTFTTRLNLVQLFFTNYPKWFHINDPSQSYPASFTV